jgi:ferredoxin
MQSITKQKTLEEIRRLLAAIDSVFIAGCGTCATMTHTGGIEEVTAMKQSLEEIGKVVTGTIVIPIACDDMSAEMMAGNKAAIDSAGAILVMSCAMGVHRLSMYIGKPLIPALDTLFIGLEGKFGEFHEVCAQCGQCILGETAAICPITACHKSLLNGPCGGTDDGKCEVDKNKDCAWTLIYNKLSEQGRLELMNKYQPPKNNQVVPLPRVAKIT